jgi:hypothetical protein
VALFEDEAVEEIAGVDFVEDTEFWLCCMTGNGIKLLTEDEEPFELTDDDRDPAQSDALNDSLKYCFT